jgi:hypothetical protein
VLDQNVTVTESPIMTHNPIRAETVNGIDVTELWADLEDNSRPVLTPEYVDVPMAGIAAVVRASSPAPAAGPKRHSRRR